MFRQEAQSFYGYLPTSWLSNLFLFLFSISTVVHICQVFYFKPKTYWLLPTVVVCGVGETMGWATRLWNTKYPEDYTPFMIQRVVTILAPIYLTAALYIILSIVIKQLGWQYSRLTAKAYIILFVAVDISALVIQVFGSGVAAVANANHERNGLVSHIMSVGIFTHMAGIILFASMAVEFILRFYFQQPFSGNASPQLPLEADDDSDIENDIKSEKLLLRGRVATVSSIVSAETFKRNLKAEFPLGVKKVVIALIICTVLVFIRTVYRAVEFLGGWEGGVANKEVYFVVFDATPIALALLILNVFTPSVLLQGAVAS